MRKNTSKKGFTLVEIMIVVVIIGLLAAMAIPAFQKVRTDSRQSALYNDARQLASAAQQYMLENNVTTIAHGYDTSDGTLGTELEEYVRQIGKGYTIGNANLTINGDFTMTHPQLDDVYTFTAEGQFESKAAPST
ncbi:prepilin-type N-terminal cleavage/methylation domain-containing protein [Pelagicoccus mobilis]|uniref:Type II secretion system protein n=1 Tax=Pelagicoccus mobilis TaxID=415221 RepID=A0A934RVZ8_9BACT|nr:type II secretion system protein [Pelagicoccus mobilis]MBK1877832.1 type II secretion system protein [Pelagicoccus mobilis]